MLFERPQEITIDASGGTKTLVVQSTINFYIITGNDTLGSDCTVTTDTAPPDGTTIAIMYAATINTGGKNLTILGTTLTPLQATLRSLLTFKFYNGAFFPVLGLDMSQAGWIETPALADKAITLIKQADGTAGRMLRYNGSGVLEEFDASGNAFLILGNGTIPQSVAQSGHVIFSNAGVSAIQNGVIINAHISNSAVIDWAKMATSTQGFFIVFNNSGIATPVAMSGHIGVDNAGATTIQPGVVTAAMLNATAALVPIVKRVSFKTGEQQDNNFTMQFNGDIVYAEANVQEDIAATDDATIQLKIATVDVTTGLITLSAGIIAGNVAACTPTGAKSFTTGQVISLKGVKPTAGGVAEVTLWVKRT